MKSYFEKVEGKKSEPEIKFYGLSYCGWCKKTKAFLDDNDFSYFLVYVDIIDKEEQKELMKELSEINPERKFPTVIVGEDPIIGYNEDKYKEMLLGDEG